MLLSIVGLTNREEAQYSIIGIELQMLVKTGYYQQE